MSDRPVAAAAAAATTDSSSSSNAVAPVLPGMAEEEADDPNEYYEPEPVDPTIDELKALSASELAHVLPDDGRTIQTWLETEKPGFSDGSLVYDWVLEMQRLRLMPFLERAELLKAMSFDDLNQLRARQVSYHKEKKMNKPRRRGYLCVCMSM